MNLPFSSVLHTNEGVFGEAIQGFTCLGLKDHFVSYRQDMFYQHSPLREKQVEELKEDELQVKNANLKSTHPLKKHKWNKNNLLNWNKKKNNAVWMVQREESLFFCSLA